MPRPADRRARIELLRAAEGVFSERGLAEAKVEEITLRAGVSKGSFYSHFDSKEDCFRQIVETFLARLTAVVLDAPLDPAVASAEDVVRHVVEQDRRVFDFCWQNRALLRMMLRGGGGDGHSFLVEELGARVRERVEQSLSVLMERGVYRAFDVSVVSALLAGGYDRLVRDVIASPRRPDLERLIHQAVSFSCRALLAQPEVADRVLASLGPSLGALDQVTPAKRAS
jgi:AcrR family transcriptional regulator